MNINTQPNSGSRRVTEELARRRAAEEELARRKTDYVPTPESIRPAPAASAQAQFPQETVRRVAREGISLPKESARDKSKRRAASRPHAGFNLLENRELSYEKDAQLTAEATQGIERFIEAVVSGAIEKALEFANVALLSGIAGSAIAPIIGQGEDASKWLTLHGGEQLAEWVRTYQANAEHQNPDVALTVATELDEHIRAKSKRTRDGRTELGGAYPKMGEEVIRMLQSLNVSQLFEQVLAESSAEMKISTLGRFRKELSRLTKSQPQNYYIYNYTLQEVGCGSTKWWR